MRNLRFFARENQTGLEVGLGVRMGWGQWAGRTDVSNSSSGVDGCSDDEIDSASACATNERQKMN